MILDHLSTGQPEQQQFPLAVKLNVRWSSCMLSIMTSVPDALRAGRWTCTVKDRPRTFKVLFADIVSNLADEVHGKAWFVAIIRRFQDNVSAHRSLHMIPTGHILRRRKGAKALLIILPDSSFNSRLHSSVPCSSLSAREVTLLGNEKTNQGLSEKTYAERRRIVYLPTPLFLNIEHQVPNFTFAA